MSAMEIGKLFDLQMFYGVGNRAVRALDPYIFKETRESTASQIVSLPHFSCLLTITAQPIRTIPTRPLRWLSPIEQDAYCSFQAKFCPLHKCNVILLVAGSIYMNRFVI